MELQPYPLPKTPLSLYRGRPARSSLWRCTLNLNINLRNVIIVQRAGCEGQRMELQQAMGQQERELRARQSAPPALYPYPRVLSADDVYCKDE